MTSRTPLGRELVGLSAEVVAAANRSLVGLKGTVVGETRNTLEIGTARGTKRIPKTGARFMFILPDGARMAVDGQKLVGRPGSRAKARKW